MKSQLRREQMKIRVWGCRGSLPAPGSETIRYGGNTTCVEVRLSDDTMVIIDAGTGIRLLGDRILAEGAPTEMYLFLTHSHWDHLMGFPFFKPAYSDRFTIKVRGGEDATKCLREYLAHQMEPPYFPVRFDLLKASFDFSDGGPEKKSIGSAQIFPIPISHPNGGYGYKFVEGDRTFVFLTDNELGLVHPDGRARQEYADFCRSADLVFHDAQYTENEYQSLTRGWGHSTIEQIVDFAIETEIARLGLTHHDPSHDDDAVDELVAMCRRRVAKKGGKVDCFGVKEGMELRV
jgi:phosphoribosyl 1,2-cyclic phosphodiesterase